MSVFDRWGGLLFFSQNPNQLWKGDKQGKKVKPGVYVLKIKAQTINGISEVHHFERYQTITVF